MSTAQKFLYGAASLSICIALITTAYTIFKPIQAAGESLNNDMAVTLENLEVRNILQYNQKYIKGSLIPGYVKAIWDDMSDIAEQSRASTIIINETPIDPSVEDMNTVIRQLMTKKDAEGHDIPLFVNPTADYYVEVGYASNGAISKVTITKK